MELVETWVPVVSPVRLKMLFGLWLGPPLQAGPDAQEINCPVVPSNWKLGGADYRRFDLRFSAGANV